MPTKIKFTTQKLKDKPFTQDRYNQLLRDEFEAQAPPGCYTIEIKREVKPKTLKQTKMIFGHMIQSAVDQAKEQSIGVDNLLVFLIDGRIPKGQEITKEFLHELMYTICPTTTEDGKRITLRKMDTTQANSLFERFRDTLAPIGINIFDPNPNWQKEKD